MVQKPQQEQQQKDGQRERPDAQNPLSATNEAAKKPQTDGGTEVTTRTREVAEWGNLPDYLGAIKQRGGVPEVSEKYRKMYDAYLRTQARKPDAAKPAGR